MQPTLFAEEEYTHDTIILGHNSPRLRHKNHSMAAMRRPFVAWDGEGYTDAWGGHHYWLLANSVGDKIVAPPGRSIERWNVARLFHSIQSRIPNAIHSGFALGYDFTMLLRANGITDEQRESLQCKQYMIADHYKWKSMMGKQLTVMPAMDGENRGIGKGDTFNLQDSWGFFQRSFVKALDEYFPNPEFHKKLYPDLPPEQQDTIENPAGIWPGTSAAERQYLIEMKKARSTFTRGEAEDANTQKYCDEELRLLVELMESLRDRLFESGMPVSRWYGPGAIANGLLQKWQVKNKIVNLYKEAPNIAGVAQHAYAGGRFELVKPGHINGPVYQYDVNSAYPYALASLPNLAEGKWIHHNAPIDLAELPAVSVVRIRFRTGVDFGSVGNGGSLQELYPLSIPFPFWRRTPNKNIHFPSTGIHGWYWLPEVVVGFKYADSLPEYYNASYTVEEAYSYYPATDEKPYKVIMDLYELRQKLKAVNNGAHIGLKLGLNSLYGKFCQQLGWDIKTRKIPQFHNLAIGGMITATCRAMMIDATSLDPSAVIAYETDGIFTTRPLPLDITTRLGGWDLTEYDDMWYLQSGFRFGIRDGEVTKSATRGIPSKDVSLPAIRKAIVNSESSLPVTHTQFVTLGQAYAWHKPHTAGQWKTSPRILSVMLENLNGKRIHDPDCHMCDVSDEGIRTYRWDEPHVTVPAQGYEGSLSFPHGVLWSTLQSDVEEIQEDVLIAP